MPPLPAAASATTPAVAGTLLAAPDVNALHWATAYAAMRGTLRGSAIASLIWGLLNMGLALIVALNAVVGVGTSLVAALLIGVFAACLFAEGLWLLVAPAPVGIIVDGIILMLIGVFNIGISVLSARYAAEGSRGLPWFGYFGIFQIVLGLRGMSRYKLFAPIGSYRPERQLLDWATHALKTLGRMRAGRDPGCVAFSAGNAPWKAHLGPQFAVAHSRGSGYAAVLERSHFIITPKPSTPLAGNQKVTVVLRDRSLDGLMSIQHLRTYQAWQTAGQGIPQ